jgi:hypothetical protein
MGGAKQGATYGSVLYMAVDADLTKLAGLPGATFRVNAYQIQGRNRNGGYESGHAQRGSHKPDGVISSQDHVCEAGDGRNGQGRRIGGARAERCEI